MERGSVHLVACREGGASSLASLGAVCLKGPVCTSA